MHTLTQLHTIGICREFLFQMCDAMTLAAYVIMNKNLHLKIIHPLVEINEMLGYNYKIEPDLKFYSARYDLRGN